MNTSHHIMVHENFPGPPPLSDFDLCHGTNLVFTRRYIRVKAKLTFVSFFSMTFEPQCKSLTQAECVLTGDLVMKQ